MTMPTTGMVSNMAPIPAKTDGPMIWYRRQTQMINCSEHPHNEWTKTGLVVKRCASTAIKFTISADVFSRFVLAEILKD